MPVLYPPVPKMIYRPLFGGLITAPHLSHTLAVAIFQLISFEILAIERGLERRLGNDVIVQRLVLITETLIQRPDARSTVGVVPAIVAYRTETTASVMRERFLTVAVTPFLKGVFPSAFFLFVCG